MMPTLPTNPSRSLPSPPPLTPPSHHPLFNRSTRQDVRECPCTRPPPSPLLYEAFFRASMLRAIRALRCAWVCLRSRFSALVSK